MITSKSLSWSGNAISNGRQKLTLSPHGARLYSFTSSRTSIRHNTRSPQQILLRPSVGQARSISLWGWGSSTSKDADFAKIHTPQSRFSPDNALGHDGQVLAQQVNPSPRSIPAVHKTSDIPSATFSHPDSVIAPSNPTSSPWNQLSSISKEPAFPDALDPAESLSAIPERIGYLKEVCGIDFGWGPSTMMEMAIEHIHIYGGVTWATSIVLLAVTARLLIFFPTVRSSDLGAKWKAAQPMIGPVREKLHAAIGVKDYGKLAEAKAEMSALRKEYGIKPLQMFLPILIQVPLQFSGFRLLRNMAELPVPALVRENWLWAQDLTLGDPFYILPVANAAILFLTIKRGGEMGTTQLQGGLMVALSYGMPVLSFIFMTFQPGAVQLYFFVSALLAYMQSRLITNKPFRKLLGLHPMVPAPKKPIQAVAPSNSSSSSSKPLPAAPIIPAGLKLYQPPPPTSTSTSADSKNTVKDVSMIDKLVDKAKSQKREVVDGWQSVTGTSSSVKRKRAQDAKKDNFRRQAEDYEKRAAEEKKRGGR